MSPVDRLRVRGFAALAAVGAGWLALSTFLLRMPLRHWWFTRMAGVFLVLTTGYTLSRVSLGGGASVVLGLVTLLAGAWAIAVGYVFGWPSVAVWVSNLAGAFGVLVGTGYLLYRGSGVDPKRGAGKAA